MPAAVSSEERCRGGGGVSQTAAAQLSRVAASEAAGKRVEIWFQDEARIGQKNKLTRVWAETGSRPTAPRDLGFESAYLFGAVCPALGKAAAIIMPRANTEAMNLHLEEISWHVAVDSHAVMFMDNAAWHSSKALQVPQNLTLLPLPPYTPELNPAERIWKYLRSHKISNRIFKDYLEILDVCVDAWNFFVADPALITSLCHVDWADSVN